MRRYEKFISLMAIAGLFLHAGLLVRHNAVVLAAAFDPLGLSGGIICRGGVAPQDLADSTGLPDPAGPILKCPVCTGAVAAAAILPQPATIAGPVVEHTQPRAAAARQQLVQRLTHIWPPTRAPPESVRIV